MSDLNSRRGLIRRLLKDKTANTLAISAAAVIPLIGVIGGGVDASRMYMAKSRLQQACDSATLAARKKLGADVVVGGNIPTDISDTADNFFAANFETGAYGTSSTSYDLTTSVGTKLDGTASTTIPTTLMAVFGQNEVDIDVKCSADLNLPNIDIVLVLDNSGSMRNSRIVALREAVFAFYDEIMAVKPPDARVRIGLIPYNASVNVGTIIREQSPTYLADSFTYQSREAIFERVMTDPGSPAVPAQPGSEQLYSDQRETVPREKSWLGSTYWFDYSWSSNQNHSSYGRTQCDAYDGTYTVNGERWVITDDDYYSNYFPDRHSSATGGCVARVRKYRTTAGTPAQPAVPPTYEDRFKHYQYKAMNFDTSVYKTGNAAITKTGTQGANVSSTWGGCIEEATTVPVTDFDPIPAGAYDMDIDLVPDPTDPDTQWRPMWPQITYNRAGPASENSTTNRSTRGFSCPVRSWKLQEYPLSGTDRNTDFETRINGMQTNGFTMHNIGMIWAGRMISPDGIFASTNATAPNGEPISRHVIFMTDGNTEIDPGSSDSYGNYDMDGRLAGFAANGSWTAADLRVIQNARLDAVCQQVKNKNVTVWTVTFGLPQNTHTKACATGASRAMESDDSDQLIANFRTIATSIAELRLVK